LFREQKDVGYDSFVKNGWNGFHRKQWLRDHVSDIGGSHYLAMKKCDDMLHNQDIDVVAFIDFDMEKLMSLAKLYPHDFDSGDLRDLSHELGLYISDVRDDDRFSNLQTIGELSQEMVETRKHEHYPMVY